VRKWVSLVAGLAALVCAESALADSPADVYSDFAEDQVLSCGHSRSVLKRTLNDASLHQYGDPLTFTRLKLAIRKQLAGSCRRRVRTTAVVGSTEGRGRVRNESDPQAQSSSKAAARSDKVQPVNGKPAPTRIDEAVAAETSGDSPNAQDWRMLLLGVVLLLITLGSGGWAARRAFTSRQ
jgi:cobalamin biosynthesis Mg chelatase CobN